MASESQIIRFRFFFSLLTVAIGFVITSPLVGFAGDYEAERARMVRLDLKGRDINDTAVLKAMGEVKRHQFVPVSLHKYAYADRPLPIGFSQTISQPYIVGLMSQLIEAQPGMKILEIGTGSGYQAAVLNRMGLEVYSIEIIPGLAEKTKQLFLDLQLPIKLKNADGYYGWQEFAPFDRIIITAAANHVPGPLIEQLKPGGRLVLPLGNTRLFQTLTIIDKKKDGKTEFTQHIGVRFVPMTGKMLE